jgi:hypothetical protein
LKVSSIQSAKDYLRGWLMEIRTVKRRDTEPADTYGRSKTVKALR